MEKVDIYTVKRGMERLIAAMENANIEVSDDLKQYCADIGDKTDLDEACHKLQAALEPFELEIECPECKNRQPNTSCCLFCEMNLKAPEPKKRRSKKDETPPDLPGQQVMFPPEEMGTPAKEADPVVTEEQFKGFRQGTKAAFLYDAIQKGMKIVDIVALWSATFSSDDSKKARQTISQYVCNWKKVYGMKIGKKDDIYVLGGE